MEPEPIPNQPEAKSDPKKVWASYGCGSDGEIEDFLVGSRAGLLRLKEHIDIAIESGKSLISNDPGILFNGVQLLDVEKEDPPESRYSPLLDWGGCIILITILTLAALGLKSLFWH
jgi:hypothetical protein